jgi:hypothetical protein
VKENESNTTVPAMILGCDPSFFLIYNPWLLGRELLRGPLYYVIVLLIIVLVFWRDSPIGIVSLSMMSGGDGKMEVSSIRHGSRSYKTPIYLFLFAEFLRLLGS